MIVSSSKYKSIVFYDLYGICIKTFVSVQISNTWNSPLAYNFDITILSFLCLLGSFNT